MSNKNIHLDFDSTVDAIGNHPAKMSSLLIFAEQPTEALGKTQLAKEFVAIQGDEPGWNLSRNSRGIPFSYCEQSLAPELLDETQIASQRSTGYVKAFKINRNGIAQGVPLSGSYLSFELDNDQTSVIQILGNSNSTSRNDRMPSLRLKIFETILSAPEGISRTELQRAVGETAARFMQLIPNLRNTGIIDISERYNPTEREVTLSEPDFINLQRGGQRVHPETHALFQTVKELVDQKKSKMSGQELLDEITSRYPQYDPAKVWRLMRIARASNAMRFIQYSPFRGDSKQHTTITIAKKFVEPVSSLVERTNRLKSDPEYQKEMSAQARKIINDPVLMAGLLAKAYRYSRHTDTLDHTAWLNSIITNIPEDGIDTRSLHEVILTAHTITYTNFRRLLTELDGQGFKLSNSTAKGRMGRSISIATLAPSEK